MLTSSDIRERFLAFFASKGHERVASSPLVPGNDPTLMFTNAGMVQFKDVFLGFDKRGYKTAVTSQRCLRAGGKHNDLENVGYTGRHHTFFEMLGNFSFGDYFKERAIPLAWELLTSKMEDGGYGMQPEHLWVTVFGGGKIFGPDSEPVPQDDQAREIWIETLKQAGFSAKEAAKRVTAIPTSDNFWMMGDTGPCGPCSEIFYNRDGKATRFEGEDEDKADSCVEIWNLVFMQFNRDAQGTLHDLPAPCVDTGMGLERLSAVLQEKKSNYDTDLFVTLVDEAAKAVENAGGNAPKGSKSLRVIADHIRACAYLVADKVLPSNEGRGYVLRRIIRRALLHGHQLGATKFFFARLVAPLAKLMGDAHPELPEQLDRVTKVLAREEERFARTLHEGLRILRNKRTPYRLAGITRPKQDKSEESIDGSTVFKLYDTYGFPTDLTASYARDYGMDIDMEGFERELAKQQERSRAASSFRMDMQAIDYAGSATRFERDPDADISGEVVALFDADSKPVEVLADGEHGLVILSKTRFYGEAGGQIGDQGWLKGDDGEAEVRDTIKVRGDVHGHQVRVSAGELRVGAGMRCEIDKELRRALCRAHSATHLLHEALRRRLGEHVEQRGSLVEGDRLRFDFSHDGQLTQEDLAAVEAEVYSQVLADAPVVTEELSYDDAIKHGAKALFGEKYGDRVRMVQIDPDYSIELCGGTHVGHASEIGLVHLQGETAIAAGIRRVEAFTGFAAQRATRISAEATDDLARLLKSPVSELASQVSDLREQLQAQRKERDKLWEDSVRNSSRSWVDKLRKLPAAVFGEQVSLEVGGKACNVLVWGAGEIGQDKVLVVRVADPAVDAKLARVLVAVVAELMSPVSLLLLGGDENLTMLASVSKQMQDRLPAKEWFSFAADAIGDIRGGGNKALAQGGGQVQGGKVDVTVCEKALKHAKKVLEGYSEYTNRGNAKGELGKHGEAIKDFDEAIRLDPDDANAYNNRGNAKRALGKHKEAIKDFDEAIRLDPRKAAAYYNRGVAKGTLGLYVEAGEDFGEAIRLDYRKATAYYNRGLAKGNLGKHEEAAKDYDEAIRLDPGNAYAYYNRGVAKGGLGKHEEAVKDYDEAIRLDLVPGSAIAYNSRGNAKAKLGKHEEAVKDYDEAIRLDPKKADAYYNRGNAKGELGKHGEAAKDYDEAIRLDPGNADAYCNRGVSKVKLVKFEEAVKDYDEAIRLDPDSGNADIYSNRGAAKGALGKHEEAVKDYDEAIRLDPRDAYAHIGRGVAKGALGMNEEAAKDFDEANRLDPGNAYAHIGRGVAKGALGMNEEADKDFDEANKLDSGDVVKIITGFAKRVLSLYEEAGKGFDEASKLEPGDANAYYKRGVAKGELGKHEEAAKDYDEAIRLDPGNADAYCNRGNAKCALGLYEEAVKDYDESIRLNPGSAEPYTNRGSAKGSLGRYEEAIEDFKKAIGIKDLAVAFHGMGLAYREIGKKDEAKIVLEKCMSLSKKQGDKDLENVARKILQELNND